jgi:hypothetical protein
MLPFLKKMQEGSMSMPVESIKRDHDEDVEYDMLESAVEDLFKAMKSNDIKSGCEALRAAFEIYDSEPHFEGPHEEE